MSNTVISSRATNIISIVILIVVGIIVSLIWNEQWITSLADSTNNTSNNAESFIQAGPFNVAVTIMPDPPKVGKNKIRVIVRDEDKKMIAGATVRAVAEMAAMGPMPAMRAAAQFTETQPGEYLAELDLPMRGEWPLAVDIETAAGHGDLIFDLATGRKGLAFASSTPGDIAHYTCSMHPSVKNATPGTCPICGMDLVPITHAELNAGTVTIDESRRQLIGVTTDVVKLKTIRKTTSAVGRITYDETRLSDVSLKFDAWIGDLYANSIGIQIKKGEPLFTVYSPELLATQEEFLESVKHGTSRDSLNRKFTDAITRKLQLWDLTLPQIQSLQKTGKSIKHLPIIASMNGTVIEKKVVAGSAIKAGQTILRIADLSKVWAEAQVYDYELDEIKIGMPATIVLPDLHDREFNGTVNYVYPFMEGDTRTVRVRVELDNANGFLRPDMYVRMKLRNNLGKRLVVPESAVLYAGQARVVFLDLGDGQLQPRRIKIGVRNRNDIEVIEGLKEGDRIVTSGNFLIAAEAKLKAGVDKW